MDYTKLAMDICGGIASMEIIIAYALVSLKKLDSQSLVYQVLNLTGGVLFMIYTIYYNAYFSAFVNFVWTIVAIIVLFQMARKK